MPIVKNEDDSWRFLRSLYYLNDTFFDENWDRSYNSQTVVRKNNTFYRPEEWPEQEPLVKILCYILMPNHIHLLVKEIREKGTSSFMKKLGQSMTNHFNKKYESKGSIFQGAYKGKTVRTDKYLRYVSVYIMVKNAFELYPGGFQKAIENFESAWKFAVEYPFGSLADYVAGRNSPIIDRDILGEIFDRPSELKSFARDVMKGGKWKGDEKGDEKDKKLARLIFDDYNSQTN